MIFLHTSDWHIGLKAAHAGAAGARLRGERFAAARRVINAANEHRVDFVIIAGDVFDDNGVSGAAVKETVAILSQSAAPVYIIPGNHDYYSTGSVWENECFAVHNEKIHVLKNNEPVEIDGAVLFPCPLHERTSTKDPTAWISCDDADSEKVRIAIAHGSLEGLPKEELDFPISRNFCETKKLDYAALGHWHSYSCCNDRVVYCGTHETDKFGKTGGFAAIVKIEKRGALPVIEKIDTGALTWVSMEKNVTNGNAVKEIVESVAKLDSQETTLVKLKLDGMIGVEEVGVLRELAQLGESGRFLYFDADVKNLRFVSQNIHTDTTWIENISEQTVKITAARIIDKLTNGSNGGGREKAVLERAVLELYMQCTGDGK